MDKIWIHIETWNLTWIEPKFMCALCDVCCQQHLCAHYCVNFIDLGWGPRNHNRLQFITYKTSKRYSPFWKTIVAKVNSHNPLSFLHCIQSCQISLLFIEHLPFNSTSGLRFSGHLLLLSFAFITHYSLTQSISLNMASKSYKATTK